MHPFVYVARCLPDRCLVVVCAAAVLRADPGHGSTDRNSFRMLRICVTGETTTGFAQAAAFLNNHRKFARPAILVSSEGDGEGPFIARMAELDHMRLDHVVLRASHVLADSDWNGGDYKLLMHSSAEIADYLSQVPIGAVVIDRTSRKLPNLHQPLLEQAIASHPEQWTLAGVFPAHATERNGIAVYWGNHNAIPQHPILLKAAGTFQRAITIDLSRPPW